MIASVLVCFVTLGLTFGTVQDQTRIPGSHGSEVVEAVVNRIRESCLFPDDKLFLRRLAYVETRDGNDPTTYGPGSSGGIWQIGSEELDKISRYNASTDLYADVLTQFGISWTMVSLSDLRKPLYSGLAAALYLTTLGEQVPQLTKDQGHFYATYFNKHSTSEEKFSKGAQTFDIVCRRTNLDIAFLVDASSSLSPEDFDRAKEFAHNVVDNFQIGLHDIRVAFVTFSTGYKSQFHFTEYTDKDALQKAIDAILKSEGQTDTDLALDFASEKLFTPAMGSRDGSSKVILLITDGKSTYGFKTIPAALRARSKGIVIFALGVGNDVDTQELIDVANKPKCTHVIQLQGYSDLNALVSEIQQVSCKAPAVLNPGSYTYPCSQGGLYQVTSSGTTSQITVTGTDGMVNIYGSLSNPTPNEAGHAFYSNAIPYTASVILLSDNHKSLYLNISTAATPYRCAGNYTIKIGTVERMKANTLVTCVDFNVARPCSLAEIYAQLYPAVMRPYSFPNECHRGPASFQPHPLDPTKFQYCGSNGTVFVFQCPPHHVYNQDILDCMKGEPSTTLSTSATTTTTTASTSTATSTTSTTATTSTSTTTTTTSPTTATATTTSTTTATTTTTTTTRARVSAPSKGFTTTKTTIPSYLTTRTIIRSTEQTMRTTPFPYNPSGNPCTAENIARNGGLYFYPYPKDEAKFIDCSNWPNFGYIKKCPAGKIWDQKDLTCLYKLVVINPTDNTFDKILNPCSLGPVHLLYFPHPTDKHRFIHCDQYGNGFESVCPDQKIWHEELLQCIHEGLVIG